MKTLYGSTFVDEYELNESNINHPIKLEYYKLISYDRTSTDSIPKFGINIVKTEYIENKTKVEEKEIKYLSSDEEKINNVLEILKQNKVTPIGVKDVMLDLSKEFLFL